MAAVHHHQPQTLEEVRTLWIGDLQIWVDENYLRSCFLQTGEVISAKVIRNKITGHPEGYGFVEFASHATAERVLQSYNGTLMPGTEQPFRLNWASFGIGERRPDAGPEHSIFVGDLAPDVSDYLLQETFRAHYPSVRGAKVVTDPSTGRSKGYGFVKFADEMERNRAMTEMNGQYCLSRPMRISAATPKKAPGIQPQPQYAVAKTLYPAPTYVVPPVQPVQPLPVENDPNNTTIYVGNLDPNITEEELRQHCLQFGEIVYVKIPASKGCGFVQFATRTSAEEAIQKLQGVVIGQQVVRVFWGRKQDSATWGQQVDPSQWGAYYGYGQGYDAYAYGAVQDPSLYAYNVYAGYAQYPQAPEGVQDMGAAASLAPGMEQSVEFSDPLATPDVDRLNADYLAVHGSAILGRSMWLTTSSTARQASAVIGSQ
ncbi:polyadenylate-binding protein RBP47B' [Amaranthus tricolor]|uniref:polyadenylate-binding protein RBP47B' n=1 Tax=Amaranthus tricolor TaxID=29722 RepID=UPI00258478A7|nr:polyadenylate-binding protein RBP47B' [Amaranthus tricolor]